jgi:hypothetical protein
MARAPKIIKFNMRLPKKLHRQVTKDARRHKVSLNTEIINRLSFRAELPPGGWVTLERPIQKPFNTR